ncbi:hypothetical protein B5180_01600 [Streptomyces sp. BF-3]|nr:hypothetical protein B5180_01600 [Streptomyces sp. BF-3]
MTAYNTTYIAQCCHDAHEQIRANHNGVTIMLHAFDGEENLITPFLRADDARTFARGILALADEVDGGEVKPASDRPIQVGDRFRVTVPHLDCSVVKVGDVAVVDHFVDGPQGDFRVRVGEDIWRFGPDNIGNGLEPITDDSEPLADWEKDLLEPDSPAIAAITTPTREAYLHRAAELLGANPSASDLIELADYLAGEGA